VRGQNSWNTADCCIFPRKYIEPFMAREYKKRTPERISRELIKKYARIFRITMTEKQFAYTRLKCAAVNNGNWYFTEQSPLCPLGRNCASVYTSPLVLLRDASKCVTYRNTRVCMSAPRSNRKYPRITAIYHSQPVFRI